MIGSAKHPWMMLFSTRHNGSNSDDVTSKKRVSSPSKARRPTSSRVPTLKKFCIHHRISGYKDRPKHVLCELIVNAVESERLDAAVHPEDLARPMPEETNSEEKMSVSPPHIKRGRSDDEEPMQRAAQHTEAAKGPEGEQREISEEALTEIMMEDLLTFCHKYGITTSNYH